MATKNINASWQFTKDAITVAEGYSVLTQGNWEALDLPHTWNGKDGQDGGNDYHRGTCYYVKNMKREEFGSEPITYIEFNGANSSAYTNIGATTPIIIPATVPPTERKTESELLSFGSPEITDAIEP